jgi:hypothetical protein
VHRIHAALTVLLYAFCLAACTSTPATWPAWVRKDGQSLQEHPALAEKARSDMIQCRADAVQAAGGVNLPTSVTIGDYAIGGSGASHQKMVQYSVAATRMEACMNRLGYRQILVPAE